MGRWIYGLFVSAYLHVASSRNRSSILRCGLDWTGAVPDGNEFEVMWMLPRDTWGEMANSATTERLDLAEEVRRWGGRRTAGRIVEDATP